MFSTVETKHVVHETYHPHVSGGAVPRTTPPVHRFPTPARHGTWRDWTAKVGQNGRCGWGVPAAAPGCSSCSPSLHIVNRTPLAMTAPCGMFRAVVRWLQVSTLSWAMACSLSGIRWKWTATELYLSKRGQMRVQVGPPGPGCARRTSSHSTPVMWPSPSISAHNSCYGPMMSYALLKACRVNACILW